MIDRPANSRLQRTSCHRPLLLPLLSARGTKPLKRAVGRLEFAPGRRTSHNSHMTAGTRWGHPLAGVVNMGGRIPAAFSGCYRWSSSSGEMVQQSRRLGRAVSDR